MHCSSTTFWFSSGGSHLTLFRILLSISCLRVRLRTCVESLFHFRKNLTPSAKRQTRRSHISSVLSHSRNFCAARKSVKKSVKSDLPSINHFLSIYLLNNIDNMERGRSTCYQKMSRAHANPSHAHSPVLRVCRAVSCVSLIIRDRATTFLIEHSYRSLSHSPGSSLYYLRSP